MKIKIIGAVFLTAGLLWAGAVLTAQAPGGDETYKTMLEDAMRSGKYTMNQAESWDARVKRISGSVRVKTADTAEWSELRDGVPLEASDSIKTGADGAAEIYLDDKAAIAVGRGTEVELDSISKAETAFTLKAGFLAAKIRNLLNEKYKMQMRLPSTVCALRGTEFAVQYARINKETGAAVFSEGRLSVTPTDEKGQTLGEYILEKNTELTFTPGQRRLKTVPLARMSRYTAQIGEMRLRLNTLKKTWKPVNQTKRQAMRDRVFKRVTGKEFGGEDTPPRPKKKARANSKVKGPKAAGKKGKKAPRPRPVYDEPEAE